MIYPTYNVTYKKFKKKYRRYKIKQLNVNQLNNNISKNNNLQRIDFSSLLIKINKFIVLFVGEILHTIISAIFAIFIA